jgi:hypothetical protein
VLTLLLCEELPLKLVLALSEKDGCVDSETLRLADGERLPLWLLDADELLLIETLVEGWVDADAEVLRDELPLLLSEALPLEDALSLEDADGCVEWEALLLSEEESEALAEDDGDDETLLERLVEGAVEELADELLEEEPDDEGALDAETLVLADTDRLPLRLPETEPLCEGERDVDRLAERDELALMEGGNVGCVEMDTLALGEELPLELREELPLCDVLALRDAEGCVE